jgi:hypothetical protein
VAKKDFLVRGSKIIHLQTKKQVGTIKKDGTCQGPHPYEEGTVIISSTPAGLRAAQREEEKLFS